MFNLKEVIVHPDRVQILAGGVNVNAQVQPNIRLKDTETAILVLQNSISAFGAMLIAIMDMTQDTSVQMRWLLTPIPDGTGQELLVLLKVRCKNHFHTFEYYVLIKDTLSSAIKYFSLILFQRIFVIKQGTLRGFLNRIVKQSNKTYAE